MGVARLPSQERSQYLLGFLGRRRVRKDTDDRIHDATRMRRIWRRRLVAVEIPLREFEKNVRCVLVHWPVRSIVPRFYGFPNGPEMNRLPENRVVLFPTEHKNEEPKKRTARRMCYEVRWNGGAPCSPSFRRCGRDEQRPRTPLYVML